MEKRQKVGKKSSTDVIDYLSEIREYHAKINSKWLAISRYFLTILAALIGSLFIQGTSESLSINARNAYTLYAILLIFPFFLLILIQFNIGNIRKNSKKKIKKLNIHNPYNISRLNNNDFEAKMLTELYIDFFENKELFILKDIHIAVNKIKINRNLLFISVTIPIILLCTFLIAYFSL